MIRKEYVYNIGKMGKTHGIGGEITMMVDDDVFDRVDSDYLILEIEGILVPFFIEEYRFKSNDAALIKFEDIDSQERASQLTGSLVYFPRAAADDAGDGNLSFAQIVGFEIIDEQSGKSLGKIESVDNSTDNILFCLEGDRLIPVAEEWIKDIDSTSSRITMSLPEGLTEINE